MWKHLLKYSTPDTQTWLGKFWCIILMNKTSVLLFVLVRFSSDRLQGSRNTNEWHTERRGQGTRWHHDVRVWPRLRTTGRVSNHLHSSGKPILLATKPSYLHWWDFLSFFFFQFALLAPKTPLRSLGAPHFKRFTPLGAQQNTINSNQKWISPFQNLKNVINNKSCWQKYLIECSVSIQMLEACPLTGKLLVFCNQLQFVKLVVKIAWSYFIFPNSEWWMCWLFFFSCCCFPFESWQS